MQHPSLKEGIGTDSVKVEGLSKIGLPPLLSIKPSLLSDLLTF